MQVSGRLLAATALPTHLTPMTSGFAAAPVHEARGQSTASQMAAAMGSSPLLGHLGPTAALRS